MHADHSAASTVILHITKSFYAFVLSYHHRVRVKN